MYFSPHAVSAFNIETCKLHRSRKYVLNKRHVIAKAELPQEGIFFALNFLPWEFLLINMLEIKKTNTN